MLRECHSSVQIALVGVGTDATNSRFVPQPIDNDQAHFHEECFVLQCEVQPRGSEVLCDVAPSCIRGAHR
jgi:hypothetical protein